MGAMTYLDRGLHSLNLFRVICYEYSTLYTYQYVRITEQVLFIFVDRFGNSFALPFLGIQNQIEQAWFSPLKDSWVASKLQGKEYLNQMLKWINIMTKFHNETVAHNYQKTIKEWYLWRKPRLSHELVIMSSKANCFLCRVN